MKKFMYRLALPILCIVTILLVTAGAVFVVTGKTFPWREEKNAVEKLIEQDAYIEGVWYPWFTHRYLGCGLTANEVMVKYVDNKWNSVGIDEIGENAILRDIVNLKAIGFNMMGYEGSPYGEGVIFDDNGDVLGIKEDYLTNVRRFLELCRKAQMPVFWSVCFHSSTISEYYGKSAWDIISQMYARSDVADHYCERFVKPLCDVLGEYRDVVYMIASGVELENETNDSEVGNHFENREVYGVNQDAMQYFINAVTNTIAEKLPDITRTICANSDNISQYNEMNFDFLGRNQYSSNANAKSISSLHSAKPVLATEFGLGDSDTIADEVFTLKQIKYRDSFIENGYRGWFFWCWQPNTYGTSYSLLAKDATSMSDFRDMAYSLHYYVYDYRAEHRGEDTVIDKPVFFYQTGSGYIEWIGARQETNFDLYRSTDEGKTWVKILSKAESSKYKDGYKCSYQDPKLPSSGTVTYKVTVYDEEGNSATSDPAIIVPVKEPAPNLIQNYSFEDDLDNWASFGSNGTNFIGKVVDIGSEAAEGSKVLELQYIDKQWVGINQSGITVKPDTNYKLTFKYKHLEDATVKSSYCFVRGVKSDGSGNGLGNVYDETLCSTYLNKASGSEQWTTDSVSFRTNSDKIGIDFRVIEGNHLYIDEIILKEVD